MKHDIFHVDGLGGERTRWSEGVSVLADRLVNIIGDVLIGAAVVAYLGPFTVDFRAVGVIKHTNYMNSYL